MRGRNKRIRQERKWRKDRWTWLFIFFGLAVAFDAWGYSVNPGDPRIRALLYLIAILFLVAAAWCIPSRRKSVNLALSLALVLGGSSYDFYYVYKAHPPFCYGAFFIDPDQNGRPTTDRLHLALLNPSKFAVHSINVTLWDLAAMQDPAPPLFKAQQAAFVPVVYAEAIPVPANIFVPPKSAKYQLHFITEEGTFIEQLEVLPGAPWREVVTVTKVGPAGLGPEKILLHNFVAVK